MSTDEHYRIYIISTELLIIFILYTVYIMRGMYAKGRLYLASMFFRYTEHIEEMDTVELQSAVLAKLDSRTRVVEGARSKSGVGGAKLAAKLAASRMLSATQINDNLLQVLAVKPNQNKQQGKGKKNQKNSKLRLLLGNQSKSFMAHKKSQISTKPYK